jgi:hypothetical protein
VGVECGGLGGDPSAASGGADAGEGDRAGVGLFEEHGEEGVGRRWSAGVSTVAERVGGGCGGAADPGVAQACPTMPATVIAERIAWPYSIRTLSARVAEPRPIYPPADPSSRTIYQAGEIAQCDFWFPPIRLPVGFGQSRTASQLPVLTMITGYARWALALLLPTRQAEDLYAGWWRLLQQLGAVPRVLVWDGEAAVGRWRARQPELTAACQGFHGVLGAKVLICKPADPEAKGGNRAAARLSGAVLSARPDLQIPDRLQYSTPGLAGNFHLPSTTSSTHHSASGRRADRHLVDFGALGPALHPPDWLRTGGWPIEIASPMCQVPRIARRFISVTHASRYRR